LAILAKLKNEFSFIRGNILINTVTLAIILVTATIPYTYYPKYIEGLGGNPYIVGVIGFVSSVTLALVQIPGGYLADKHGRRWLTIIMTFAISITYFLFAVAPNWQFFMIASILQNLFLVYQPALQALVADSTPPEKRGLGFSIINLLHYISVPSPIIAGVLAVRFGLIPGMRIAYLFVTAAFLVAAILRMRFKETLKTTVEENPLTGAIRNFPKSITESVKALKTASHPMLFLFVSFAIYHFAWFMCSYNLIFYATDIVHIKEFEWAALMTWFSVVNILSALPCGKIVDRFGRKKPLTVAWFLFIPGLISFVYGNIIIISIGFLFLGVALILSNTAYPALMADFVARDKRGKIIGSTNFFSNILSSLGALSGGFMYQYLSPALPFLLSATLFIPCLILTLFKVHEPTSREK
jgi:DHA1 family multidrug resistance protein-like MFS transporter